MTATERYPSAPEAVVNGPLPWQSAFRQVSVEVVSCWCKGPITTCAGEVGFGQFADMIF